MYLATNLRYLRRKADLTQENLATDLDTDVNTIRRWEKGQSAPKLPHLSKLAELFKLSIEQLKGVDLTLPPVVAEAAPPYGHNRVAHPLAARTEPVRNPVEVLIKLDGTPRALERAIRLIGALNDAVADNAD